MSITDTHPTMTPAEQERQRRGFAFGNTHLSNPLITRRMIDEAADRIAEKPSWYGRRASEHALPLTDLGCRTLGVHLTTTTIKDR